MKYFLLVLFSMASCGCMSSVVDAENWWSNNVGRNAKDYSVTALERKTSDSKSTGRKGSGLSIVDAEKKFSDAMGKD